MDEKWFGVIEMSFVYGVVFAFAIWQLVSVRRSIRKDKEEAARKDQEERAAETAKPQA